MRRVGLLIFLLGVTGPLWALSLGTQARHDAALLNDFLQAAYAQRQSDPQRFAKLHNVLKQMPDSAYIKQQLVAEALAAEKVELADLYADFIEDESAQKDPDAWAVYGAYQWRKGNVAEATQAYEKALELDPDDERILFQYITVLVTSDPDKAAQTLDSLAKSRPLFAADIYTEKGRMYLFYKRYEDALRAFNQALAVDSQQMTARLGRADVYEKTNQYFLMLHELEELDKMGFANAQTLSRMGAVYVLVQDFPKAEQYFLRAKQDENDNIPAGNFLALLAEQRGEYEKAIALLQQTADYAQDPAKQVQVSYYQRKLNQPQESFNTLRHAYEQFPTNNEVAYLYAIALNERKNYKQAARILESLIEKFPNSQDAHLQYAFALEGLKKYAQVEEQVNLMLEKNPNNAAALNLWAFSLAERGVQLDKAAEYSARALAVWPQDHSLQDTQLWIFYKQGKLQEATGLINAFPSEYVADNAEVAYHIGMVYQALGQTDLAHPYLQQAAQRGWKPAKKALKKLK